METTIYLIRHSNKFDTKMFGNIKTSESLQNLKQKIILSDIGEERAKIMAGEKELQNIDKIYASNYVRTMETAKYMAINQNLKINIDERIGELVIAAPKKVSGEEFWNILEKTFADSKFKREDGESQEEVRKRMLEFLNEVLEQNSGKRVAVFSHGFAIMFLMLNWANLVLERKNKNEKLNIKITYNGNILVNGRPNSPDVFKLIFDENKELINMENIKFNDLPYLELE